MSENGEERFGAYRLDRYLAAGGMADLYLAHRDGSEEDLVLKRIQQRYLDHTRVVKLFIDEGRIAQTLQHPNIVRVVDVGNLLGTYYIAMEYISGHDLIAIARRGVETGRALPRAAAVGIVAQVATGLAFAHTRVDQHDHPLSIVHCDISPGNIVVSWRGTAKIVDFGIARATIALREEEHVAGKYNYMAPEQIRGDPVDARADLFALGVILYELTLGKRLFKGRPEVVRRKVLDGRIPRPRELAADYPEALERILSRLLARDPEQRYPSAAALRSDLRAWLSEQGEGWTKREIARYLRDLFRASRDITAQGELAAEEDDEELVLEHAMPHLADDRDEIDADPDDADEESPSFTSAFASEAPPAPADVTPVEGTPVELPAAEAPTAEVPVSIEETPLPEPLPPAPETPPPLLVVPEPDTAPNAIGPSLGRVQVGELAAAPAARPLERPLGAARGVEIGGETAQVRMPPRVATPEPETALVRLPYSEETRQVFAPRRRRRRGRISSGVVIGTCMIVAAAVLLGLFLTLR
jgi:serine/threonine protein kinase